MPQINIYKLLYKYRHPCFLFFIIIFLGSVFSIFNSRIENNGLVFIPDSREELRIAANILSASPAANILFIDVEGDKPGEALEVIKKAIPESLATPLDKAANDFRPADLIRSFPVYFSEEASMMLDAQLSEQGIAGLMRENLRLLQGFGGIGLVEWVKTDPLQLRTIFRKLIPANVETFGNSISRDGRHALLLYRPAGSAFDTKSAKRLVEIVRNNVPEGYTLAISGAPVHTEANARTIEKDLIRITGFSLAGFCATYALLARSWGALWILFTAVASTIIAIGCTGFAWPTLSGITIGFGASLMGLSEDYAVHMHFALRSGIDHDRIYSIMDLPLLQSFILNCSGFIVLFFSSIPVMRQMAFFAVVSLASGFLLAMIILPFFKSFSRPVNIREKIIYGGKVPSLIRGFGICAILIAGCALLYKNLDFNFSPKILGAENEAIQTDTDKIKTIWNIGAHDALIIQRGSRDEALQESRKIAQQLRESGIDNILAPSDFLLPELEKKENIQRWRDWLEKNSILEKMDQEAEKAGFSSSAFDEFREALRQECGEIKGLEDFLMLDNTALIRIQGDTKKMDQSILEKGFLFSSDKLEQGISSSFAQEKMLMLYACLAIFFLVWGLLHNPARVLAVFVPPIFSLLAVFSVFVFFKLPFTLACLAVIPIVFGLSLDHGVMVTHSLEKHEALGIRKAVIMASITAFLSIGLLAISSHPTLRAMGIVVFAGLTGELIAALFLVPFIYPTTGNKT